MDTKEAIREIKAELRQSMNGVASAYMRDNGVNYKLNFGVELPRLRDIASRYAPDHELAQALWKEDVRECKLLAAMLQPVETFYPEIAEIWADNMPNAEIAQHTVQDLFCRLPYASQMAFEWIAVDDGMRPVCGFLILARLFMEGRTPNERSADEFLDQVRAALHGEPSLRRAAVAALQKYQGLGTTEQRDGDKLLSEEGF